MLRIEDAKNLVIYYADDDQDDLDMFQDIICELRNAELHTRLNGMELLNSLENPPADPHIIFLDLNMPGKNGLEVLREIRTNSRFSQLPVVILSTSSDERIIARSRALGASYYIPKPNDFTTLRQSVYHALSIDWKLFNPETSGFVFKSPASR